MSLDRSLKVSSATASTRSVMTRAERISKLIADKKMDPKAPLALGLPKTLSGKR